MSDRNKVIFISEIDVYRISNILFNKTINILKNRGKKREEGLVLWSGIINPKLREAYIMNIMIPKNGHWGGGVTLTHKTILRIIDVLTKKGHFLLAQVHTHPGNFGHSYGDERTPVSHRIGFISIVVPDYALFKVKNMEKFFVYEYMGNFEWRLHSKSDIERKFVIDNYLIKV